MELRQFERQLPWLALVVGLYIAIVALNAIGIIDDYYMINVLQAGIYVILGVSLNLINGFTGQFSIGHAGFMAVGAYAGAICTVNFGLPFFSCSANWCGSSRNCWVTNRLTDITVARRLSGYCYLRFWRNFTGSLHQLAICRRFARFYSLTPSNNLYMDVFHGCAYHFASTQLAAICTW